MVSEGVLSITVIISIIFITKLMIRIRVRFEKVVIARASLGKGYQSATGQNCIVERFFCLLSLDNTFLTDFNQNMV